MEQEFQNHLSRETFLKGVAATGVGAAVGEPAAAPHRGASIAGSCTENVHSILDSLLVIERLTATFYYVGLTSPRVMGNRQLAGGAGNPHNPGLPPGGHPSHVRYLQAALDAERKHAILLAEAGATAPQTHFYFPRATFEQMGTSTDRRTFLGVLDQLETASVGAYVAAVNDLASLRLAELAGLAAGLAGVEAEHRMLGRALAGIKPANNLTLEGDPFACTGDVQNALQPFLTGRGFAGGATRSFALPSQAQIDRMVGKYGTLLLRRFL